LPISLEALRRTPRGSGEPSGGCGERNSLLLTNVRGRDLRVPSPWGWGPGAPLQRRNDRWTSQPAWIARPGDCL